MSKSVNIKFDIIPFSETKILKGSNIVKNVNVINFPFLVYFKWINSRAGGTSYFAGHLAQNWNHLNLFKKNNLESTFIEITNPDKSNIIVGCFYRHPKMYLIEFSHYYLHPLWGK